MVLPWTLPDPEPPKKRRKAKQAQGEEAAATEGYGEQLLNAHGGMVQEWYRRT